MNVLLVFVGGGLGSLCRYGLGLWLGPSNSFPLATFVANILSCILLGVLVALASRQLLSPEYRLLLITGFCGGFSTFSTFSYELVQLMRQAQWLASLFYMAASLLAGLASLYLAIRLAQ